MRKPIPKTEYEKLLDWIKENLVLSEQQTVSLLEHIDNYGQEKYSDGADAERFYGREY